PLRYLPKALSPPRSGCHLAAMLGAAAADLDTPIHLADFGATVGASFADFGADGAGSAVEVSSRQHEVRAGPAHLCAGEHQAHMRRLDMTPARLQTMPRRLAQAGVVAFVADRDAALQIVAQLKHGASVVGL